jgi:folate-dependent tRNA-U54 methylase TrmFO/GidA
MTIPEYDICACGERGPHEHSIETTRRIEAELRTSVKDSLKKPNWDVQSKVIGAKMKVIEAELLEMTAANSERVYQGQAIAYDSECFLEKVVELKELVHELSEVAKSHSGL